MIVDELKLRRRTEVGVIRREAKLKDSNVTISSQFDKFLIFLQLKEGN